MMDYASEIKARITCRDFADHVGLKVNRSGFAVCPFHGDNDASLKIYKGDRGWCCFGCHKGGDVINLASLWYGGTTFKETMQRLNDEFNLGMVPESQEKPEIRALRAVEAARRKTERLKKERLYDALKCRYWRAFDLWFEAERRFWKYAPQTPDDEFTDEFAKAARDKLERMEDLERLEMEIRYYEE